MNVLCRLGLHVYRTRRCGGEACDTYCKSPCESARARRPACPCGRTRRGQARIDVVRAIAAELGPGTTALEAYAEYERRGGR